MHTSLAPPLRLVIKALRVRSPLGILIELNDASPHNPLEHTHEVVHTAQLIGERLQDLLVFLDHTPDGLGLMDLDEVAREYGPTHLVDAPLDVRGQFPVLVSAHGHCCCCVKGACVR